MIPVRTTLSAIQSGKFTESDICPANDWGKTLVFTYRKKTFHLWKCDDAFVLTHARRGCMDRDICKYLSLDCMIEEMQDAIVRYLADYYA